MSNYTIPQETFCKYCEFNFNINRNSCEGINCEKAKDCFLEDHEISEVYANLIKDLRPGQKVCVIYDDKIQRLTINKVSYSEEEILIEIGNYSFCIDNNNFNESSFYNGKGFFLKKEDAVNKYKEIISEKMFKMHEMLNKI